MSAHAIGPAAAVPPSLDVVVAASMDPILVADATGTILRASPSLLSLLGWDEDALRGRSFRVLLPEPWRSLHDRILEQALKEGGHGVMGGPREVFALARDGRKVLVAISLARTEGPRGPLFFAILSDRSAERARHELLCTALESAERTVERNLAAVARVTHALQSPLGGIVGLAEEVLGRLEGDDLRGEMRAILDLGHTASEIVSAFRAWRESSEARDAAELVPVDPRAAIEGLLSGVRQRLERQDVDLLSECDASVPATVLCDLEGVKRVLRALLENAVRYTERGFVGVALRAAEREGRAGLVCRVRDTGVGIHREDHERIFEPFLHADAQGAGTLPGIGLGLSIAERTARAMGGEVTLIDSRPQQGTTWEFWFPTRPPEQGEKVAPRPRLSLRRDLRVLLVEDDAVLRRISVRHLETEGISVDAVADGHAGVEVALRESAGGQPYDAVVMDLLLPGLDGHEAAATLRQQGFAAPILAFTAEDSEAARKRSGTRTRPSGRATRCWAKRGACTSRATRASSPRCGRSGGAWGLSI